MNLTKLIQSGHKTYFIQKMTFTKPLRLLRLFYHNGLLLTLDMSVALSLIVPVCKEKLFVLDVGILHMDSASKNILLRHFTG